MGKYIWEACLRAWKKYTTRTGFWTNIFLFGLGLVAYWLVAEPTWEELEQGEYVMVICLFLGSAILLGAIYIVWELQAVFARIEITPKNNIYDCMVSLEIFVDERKYLEDFKVELKKMYYILNDGSRAENTVLLPNNYFFADGLEETITYEGRKVVKIARGLDGSPTFLLETPISETFFETFNNRENMTYDIEVEIKGKIDDKPIYPKKFNGHISFWRQEQEFRINYPINGEKIISQLVSRMYWENT